MTRLARKADLTPAFVLHHRPYRDTSRILELFSREHGRVSLFARGVRGVKSRSAPLLQPFRPLLVSWRGRGDAAQLTGVELDAAATLAPLPTGALLAAYYLNELLIALTTRDDPHPTLFDAYVEALAALAADGGAEAPLRRFEWRFLGELGYGVDFAHEHDSGRRVDPGGRYVFRAGAGFAAAVADAPDGIAGESLVRFASGMLTDPRDRDVARRVLRAALDYCLDGRELATRTVARAIAGRERPR
jgi:DNA repair protein RecO (recombination protein O)